MTANVATSQSESSWAADVTWKINEDFTTAVGAAPHILLVDDDVIFRAAFTAVAHKYDTPVSCVNRFDVFEKAVFADADLIVMDYQLGSIDGVEFANLIENKIGDIPILLVSGRHRQPTANSPWPAVVRAFCHKDCGIESLFHRSLQVYNANKRALSPRWFSMKNLRKGGGH